MEPTTSYTNLALVLSGAITNAKLGRLLTSLDTTAPALHALPQASFAGFDLTPEQIANQKNFCWPFV